jgi:hypothetical protein
MRGASVLLVCGVFLVACTSNPAPTNSSGPTNSPGSSSTPGATATPAPSPTLGEPDDRGFPTSILGLPVHTVAGINELVAQGKLDGRLAAVAGYWSQQALPCAFQPHIAVLSGYCAGGTFADTPEAAEAGTDRDAAPVVVPETAGDLNSGAFGSPKQVVLIVHAGDSRAYQCAPADREACQSRLVVDYVPWMDGTPLAIGWYLDAISEGVHSGEQVLSLFQLAGTDMSGVEPRMMAARLGLVVFVRLITGTPDADGISDGVERLVSIDTSQVVAEEPLQVDPGYSPARVVLDALPPDGVSNAQFLYGISIGPDVIAGGALDSSTPPLVLEPGDYIVHGSVNSGAIVQDPLPCELPLSLEAGADVAYYAQFDRPSGCTWQIGEWPFN